MKKKNVCEACKGCEVQYTLIGEHEESSPYKLCANCLTSLILTSLSKKEFKNLLKNKHTVDEFLLHSDFYHPTTGEAFQPSELK